MNFDALEKEIEQLNGIGVCIRGLPICKPVVE